MSFAYLDCETSREGRDQVNPKLDKLVSITIQIIDSITGNTIGDLEILKSWETSEELILWEFHQKTGWLDPSPDPWRFVPIGFNLAFDLLIIYCRTKQVLGKELDLQFLFYDLLKMDIKPLAVLANGGKFKGASLDMFCGKRYNGAKAYECILAEKWEELVQYIVEETECFLNIYQQLLRKFPGFHRELLKKLK